MCIVHIWGERKYCAYYAMLWFHNNYAHCFIPIMLLFYNTVQVSTSQLINQEIYFTMLTFQDDLQLH